MKKNKSLVDLEEQIRQCVKCGICQAHCPAYRQGRREGDVARGKVALASSLLDGSVQLERRLEEDISMCLMCGSCVGKCPNKVPTPEIVGAIRREITDSKGLSLIGKSVAKAIRSKAMLQTLSKSGAALSPLLLRKVPGSSGLRLRFPSPVMKGRTLPRMPLRNLFERTPEFVQGQPDQPVVGFFAGCSLTYVYPQVGLAMIEILNRLGYSVHIPRAQRCCGIPALSSGAGRTVEELAEINTSAFGRYDETAIITGCASCYGGIGEYYGTMSGVDKDFSDKVIDFTVFLERQGLVERLAAMPPWQERARVTYHDPCHLKNNGITAAPRALLQALPNVEFVEMENASLCCGLGGTFSVYHYDCSQAIGSRKIPGLRESGAEKIATACPGCIIQLQDIINHAGLQVEAVHLLSLIREALTAESDGSA